jgi:hypothetical protein
MDLLKRSLAPIALAGAVAAVAAPIVFQQTPANVVGEWRYTTINGRSYWDGSTGQYLGHGGGNSETLVFAKDGTFKDYVYMENSPSAGWTTKIYTTMEGRVEWSEGSFKLVPSKGNYKVQDNRVARQNYERPMNEADLQRMTKTYRYTTTMNAGKPVLVLYIGDTPWNYKKAN